MGKTIGIADAYRQIPSELLLHQTIGVLRSVTKPFLGKPLSPELSTLLYNLDQHVERLKAWFAANPDKIPVDGNPGKG